MRSLETIPPLVVGSAGVGVTPGPSHWKTGVLVTPLGRVTEQVRVMVSPAMMEEEEEVREMAAGSGEEIRSNTLLSSHSIPIVIFGAVVTVLGSVVELATTLIEYVTPAISPVMVALVRVASTIIECSVILYVIILLYW